MEFERIDADDEGLEFENEFIYERLEKENMNKEGGEWTREEEERRGRREHAEEEEEEGKWIFYFYFYLMSK